ncbi:hypothetical protein OWR29_20125 [Actinoplanes sp. Pm04-4]|uniref:Uncharacterized protein n=1 Tax=Paractinoplanes pyxinae TaxID=2997416 RepID=A0ABT4B1D9_9ACTN|nr:hypothetical protein [Actinoplanes pyxinae]MCY1140313.1 hypothetical protein [Actinoplanes pyxinae]
MPTTVHDVAILADFRFAGPEVATEVRAQADAALSTVLVHVPLPGDERPLPFEPPVRDLIRDGLADLARDDRPVTARLLVIRGRRPIVEDLPDVRAQRTVAVDDPEQRSGRSHLRWLAGFGIRPRISAPARTLGAGPPPAAPARRMLLVGGDEDSLIQLTAIARRLPPQVAPVIVTLSTGPVDGFLTEHIPSRAMRRDRLAHLVDLHRPDVVVAGGLDLGDLPEVPGVVRVGLGAEAGVGFDHVLVPGELADGAEPITLLDASDLLDAAAARAELGLDDTPAALVRLGEWAGTVAERGFQVVRRDRAGRHLRAFDLVVGPADYHGFHEQLRFGVPSVFVPGPSDPGGARARFAQAAGVALDVADLDRATRPEVREALRRRCEELTFANGATGAATWLSGLAAGRRRIGG